MNIFVKNVYFIPQWSICWILAAYRGLRDGGKWWAIKYLKKPKDPFFVLRCKICGIIKKKEKKQLFITLTQYLSCNFQDTCRLFFSAYCSFPWWRLTHRVELCLIRHCAFIETGTTRYYPAPGGKPHHFIPAAYFENTPSHWRKCKGKP